MNLPFGVKLKHINIILFIVIMILDGYIVCAPLLPAIAPRTADSKPPLQTIATHMATSIKVGPDQLIMPTIQLDQRIYEGRDTYAELDKGVWRWPDSSTPDKGSNTVLLGHRFTYTSPRGVFYFLDAVKIGDSISVIWQQHTYTYRVYNTEVVSPDHVEILEPTAEPTLTVFTCTPTWWPVNRLVILAHLETRT